MNLRPRGRSLRLIATVGVLVGLIAVANQIPVLAAVPLSITTNFTSASINIGQSTTLQILIQNPGSNPAITGLNFTNSGFQPYVNVTGASTSATNTCGSGVSPTFTANSISLGAASLAPNATCEVDVTLTGAQQTAGTSFPIGPFNYTLAGTPPTAGTTGAVNTTGLIVNKIPNGLSATKSFSPATIASTLNSATTNTVTALKYSISNNSGTQATNVGFSDPLPAGSGVAILSVPAPPSFDSGCTAGGVTPALNTTGGNVQFSGGAIAPSSTCNITIYLSTPNPGSYTSTPSVVTSVQIADATFNPATLKVLSDLTAQIQFVPATVTVGQTSTMTIELTNPNNADTVSGVSYTVTIPINLSIVSIAPPTNCGGGTATFTAPTLSFTGGSIAPSGKCDINVTVTPANSSNPQFQLSTSTIQTANAGIGAASSPQAILNVTMLVPPTVSKTFGGATSTSASFGTPVTLNIQIVNTNMAALTGVNLTDPLPTGSAGGQMKIAPTTGYIPGANCGTGVTPPVAGDTSINIVNTTIPANSTCSFFVNVVTTKQGTFSNTTGAITFTGGTGGTTSNTATLTVTPLNALTVTKAFNPTGVIVGQSSTVTITLQNTSTTALTGVNFNDVLPSNAASVPLLITNTIPANASANCLTAGGVVPATVLTAAVGTGTVSLQNGAIPASASCVITFSVSASGAGAAGIYTNPVFNVTSNEAASASSAAVPLDVFNQLTTTKAFSQPTIKVGQTSILTITITNPAGNPATANGVSFTDTFPAGLIFTGFPNAVFSSPQCGTAPTTTLTANSAASPNTLVFTGGTIPVGQTCTITANVTANTVGTYTNAITNFATTNAGAPASVTPGPTLTVNAGLSAPGVTKSFGAPIAPGGNTLLTIAITNTSGTTAITGVNVTDNFPTVSGGGTAQMVIVGGAIPQQDAGCAGGTLTALTGGKGISYTGGSIAASGTCNLTVSVTAPTAGSYVNVTSPVTSNEAADGGPATGTLIVLGGPSAAVAFNPATIGQGGTSTLQIVISNPNAVAISGVGFTDTLTGGLTIATTPAGNTVGCGTITTANFNPTAGASSFTFNGGTVAAAVGATPGTCTISLNVTAPNSIGSFQSNLTGGVSSAGAIPNASGILTTQAATNTPTATLSPTPVPFITATPYPLTASLTANNLTPTVGSTEVFTLTVQDPGTGVTVGLINGSLQIDNSVLLTPNPANYTNVTPGTTVTFTFSHVVTNSDTCSLNPIATVNGTLNPSAPSPIQLTPVFPTLTSPINVQRIGLSATVSTAPSFTSVGSSLGTSVTASNTGCLSENVSGILSVNGNNTADPVTNNSGGSAPYIYTIAAGSSLNLYSTHLVSAVDVNGGTQVPFSYALNATAANGSGLTTSANSSTVNVPLLSSITATPTPAATGVSSNGIVTISKTASEASAHAGDTITFTVTLTNSGTTALSNATITDNVVSPLTVVSAASDIGSATNNAGNVTAAIGSIPAGGAAHLTIVTKVGAATAPALIANSATANWTGGTPLTASISIPIATGAGAAGGVGVLPVTGYGPPPDETPQFPLGVLVAVVGISTLVGVGAYVVVHRVR